MAIRDDAHRPEFHRAAPPQLPVRCATTANITIATALNNGDSLDGLTLASGDRVLVKDQSTGSQNGIYIVGASPARAFDMAEGVAAWGAIVYVIAGTANGGTLWKNTNATLPTIDTTALTFAQFSSATSFGTPAIVLGTAAAAGAASTAVRTDATIVAFDATVPVTQALGDSAAAGSAAVAARRDHKHGMPALSSATPIVASGSGAVGTALPSSREDHVHPAGAGSGTLTTVEEVDGSPTDSAVTKLVLPNGTLSIASHVATYTPATTVPFTEVCSVYGNNVSTTNGAEAALACANENYDATGMHDTVTNNSRVTIATAGKYHIDAQIAFAPNSSGQRGIELRLNGASIANQFVDAATSPFETRPSVAFDYLLAASDYLEVYEYQNSGGALNASVATFDVHRFA